VGGKRREVPLPANFGGTPGGAPGQGLSSPGPAAGARRSGAGRGQAAAAGGDSLASPMQGTIVKIAVADGDEVAEGDLILVLEAMKMEQPINAPKAGVVSGLAASVGDVVTAGTVLCRLT
jgi:acetyl-CoA/propionyl-CoA carboxylase, biotin carboxylase, biotin carboxyl carrier protein